MLGVINRQASRARQAPSTTASRLRGGVVAALLLAVSLPSVTATAVQAGDVLTSGGVALTPILLQAGVPTDVRRAINLNGDQPIAVYVMASGSTGTRYVRTRQGYWLPWSGRIEDLVDAGFAPQGGQIEYKLVKEELPRSQLPITVTVAYRTAAEIKFGFFELRSK